MQLIIPRPFQTTGLTLIGVTGIALALYGPVSIAALLFAFALYGLLLPKYLEHVAGALKVSLLEHVRGFREDELEIPFRLDNPSRFPLGKLTVSGLLSEQVKVEDGSSQFWRHHMSIGGRESATFQIRVAGRRRGIIRIQSFDVILSDPFHLMNIYISLPIQTLGHIFPDFAPASVGRNERLIPGETDDRSSPFTDRSSFHSVIPYVGDAKSIYWSAYAKTGQLYSYQHDRMRNHDYAIIIDGLSPDGMALRSDFEKLLARAATITRELERQGASYSLWISMVDREGQWYHVPSARGRSQFLRVMECLARLSEYDLPLERRYFLKRLQRSVPSTTARIHLGYRSKEVSA